MNWYTQNWQTQVRQKIHNCSLLQSFYFINTGQTYQHCPVTINTFRFWVVCVLTVAVNSSYLLAQRTAPPYIVPEDSGSLQFPPQGDFLLFSHKGSIKESINYVWDLCILCFYVNGKSNNNKIMTLPVKYLYQHS